MGHPTALHLEARYGLVEVMHNNSMLASLGTRVMMSEMRFSRTQRHVQAAEDDVLTRFKLYPSIRI